MYSLKSDRIFKKILSLIRSTPTTPAAQFCSWVGWGGSGPRREECRDTHEENIQMINWSQGSCFCMAAEALFSFLAQHKNSSLASEQAAEGSAKSA